jgi:hypothetical protein
MEEEEEDKERCTFCCKKSIKLKLKLGRSSSYFGCVRLIVIDCVMHNIIIIITAYKSQSF